MKYRMNANVVINDQDVNIALYDDGWVYYKDDSGVPMRCQLFTHQIEEVKDYAPQMRNALREKSFVIDDMLNAMHHYDLDNVRDFPLCPYPISRIITAFICSNVSADEIIKDCKTSGIQLPKGLKVQKLYLGGWQLTVNGNSITPDQFLQYVENSLS